MLQDQPANPNNPVPTRRRVPHAALVVAIVVLIIAGLVAVVFHNAGNFYVFSPGTAPQLTASSKCSGKQQLALPNGTPCVHIGLPANLVHTQSGKLFMVDVLVGQASASDYLLHELGLLNYFHKGSQLIPAKEYTGGANPAQVQCESVAQMTGSQEDAPVAALRRLGYQVPEDDLGATVLQVSSGTPAAAAGLKCNDVITAVDGKPVHTAQQLVSAIHALKPGDTVSIQRRYVGTNGKTTTSVSHATLTTTPASVAKQSGDSTSTAFLGVATQTDVTYHLPFPVSIDAGDIGGPSAGLAFTLGIIDLLSGGHLTGGHAVAATGEIDTKGNVLEVGGVAQKALAVEKAGATVFIVPKGDYSAALSEAHGKLKVYPVTTLAQALSDLAALGGTIPPQNFAATHPLSG